MKLIDLTRTFAADTPVLPGDPALEFTQAAQLDKEGYNDHKIHMVMHIGTHMDAPLHMIAGGKKMAEIPADRLVGKGIVVDARGKSAIDEDLLTSILLEEGMVVLVLTGFSEKFGTEEGFNTFPRVTEAFAQKLVEAKVKILGLDTVGPDDPPYPVHKMLLGNDILIIENLTNLESLISVSSFTIWALPAKWETDATPVRVVADVHA